MNLVLNLGIRTLLIMGLSLSHPSPESPPEETTILNFVLNSPFFLSFPLKKIILMINAYILIQYVCEHSSSCIPIMCVFSVHTSVCKNINKKLTTKVNKLNLNLKS